MESGQEAFQVNVSYSPSGARILTPVGPMNIRTLFDFQAISRAESDKPVIIDLAGVPYMDSAALGSVLSVFTRCQSNGLGFGICGLSERLRMLMKVTQVDGLLPIFASVEEAAAGIAAGPK
jgi:anti-anti-sigma factor